MLALDADTSVEVLCRRNALVGVRYAATDPLAVVLPSIVAGELMIGALKSVRPNATTEPEGLSARHAIVPFGEAEFRRTLACGRSLRREV